MKPVLKCWRDTRITMSMHWPPLSATIATAFQPTYEAGSPRPDDIAAHIGNLAYQPEYPA